MSSWDRSQLLSLPRRLSLLAIRVRSSCPSIFPGGVPRFSENIQELKVGFSPFFSCKSILMGGGRKRFVLGSGRGHTWLHLPICLKHVLIFCSTSSRWMVVGVWQKSVEGSKNEVQRNWNVPGKWTHQYMASEAEGRTDEWEKGEWLSSHEWACPLCGNWGKNEMKWGEYFWELELFLPLPTPPLLLACLHATGLSPV
jgi:hypothetical protein